MVTSNEILKQLKGLGQESIKKVLLKHSIKEPLYGVKVEELKKILKQTKENYSLSLELFDSGIYDAMYLAGLMAEPGKMTKKDLQQWVQKANAPVLHESTVAWVASESQFGKELALEWINSKNEGIASSGWATLSSLVSIKDDSELDIPLLKQLLERAKNSIHSSPNRVKLTMNGFVISVGIHVKELNELAKQTAKAIGNVTADMGETACKVPLALEYISKAESKNSIGKKGNQPVADKASYQI